LWNGTECIVYDIKPFAERVIKCAEELPYGIQVRTVLDEFDRVIAVQKLRNVALPPEIETQFSFAKLVVQRELLSYLYEKLSEDSNYLSQIPDPVLLILFLDLDRKTTKEPGFDFFTSVLEIPLATWRDKGPEIFPPNNTETKQTAKAEISKRTKASIRTSSRQRRSRPPLRRTGSTTRVASGKVTKSKGPGK